MKLRSFKYFVTEGLKSIWINRLMSLASIMTVTASLLIFSLFLIITLNVDHMVSQIRDEYELQIIIDENADDAKTAEIGEQIVNTVGVKANRLVTKEEGLQQMKETVGNSDYFDGLELNNPLRDTYFAVLNDIGQSSAVEQEIAKIDGVAEVKSSTHVVDALLRITRIVNIVSIWIYVLLLIISISIITNTIRIAVYARRKEINIMKFIGATNWFIRWPFIVEGMAIGLIAALLSILIMSYTYGYITNGVLSMLGGFGIAFTLKDFGDVIGIMSLSSVVLGMLSGAIGSVISVRKHLKV